MTRWRLIALAASLWTLTSCAGNSRIVPPVTVAPKAAESESINAWLNGLLGAYRDNCVVLKVMRHEDTKPCAQP